MLFLWVPYLFLVTYIFLLRLKSLRGSSGFLRRRRERERQREKRETFFGESVFRARVLDNTHYYPGKRGVLINRFPDWIQRPVSMTRSILQSALTSGCVMACGDVLCQIINPSSGGVNAAEEASTSSSSSSSDGNNNTTTGKREENHNNTKYYNVQAMIKELDYERTLRFFTVGLTLHGPMFHYALPWLHRVQFCRVKRLFGNWQNHALPKVALGHVTLFPAYTSMFLGYLGVLEGLDFRENVERMESRLPDLLIYGSAIWPVANVVNFAYVPLHRRLLYLNMIGVGWNAFLSFQTCNGADEREGANDGSNKGGSNNNKSSKIRSRYLSDSKSFAVKAAVNSSRN